MTTPNLRLVDAPMPDQPGSLADMLDTCGRGAQIQATSHQGNGMLVRADVNGELHWIHVNVGMSFTSEQVASSLFHPNVTAFTVIKEPPHAQHQPA